MKRRIYHNRPSGDHGGEDSPNARLNLIAAFRGLIRSGRPVPANAEKDKKPLRRGPGGARGLGRSRGESHLGTETDDAVEGSTSGGGGDGDRDEGHGGGDEGHEGGRHESHEGSRDQSRGGRDEGRGGGDEGRGDDSRGGGGSRDFLGAGGVQIPSLFSTLRDAIRADDGRSLDAVAPLDPSRSPVWPVAALRSSWKLADPPPTPYAPPADLTTQAGAVPPARRLWLVATAVQPYAPPSAPSPAAQSRYIPFVPPLQAAASAHARTRGMAPGWRLVATPLRPFVPSNVPAPAARRAVQYRPFTPSPDLAAKIAAASALKRPTRYSPFTPLPSSTARIAPALPHRLGLGNRVVAQTRPYRLPEPFSAARSAERERRLYTPPPLWARGIEAQRPLKLGAGDERWPPMSIDTLLDRIGPRRNALPPRAAAAAAALAAGAAAARIKGTARAQ